MELGLPQSLFSISDFDQADVFAQCIHQKREGAYVLLKGHSTPRFLILHAQTRLIYAGLKIYACS